MAKIFMGNIKGPKGDPGPKGDSYVLTEADRTAVADAIRASLKVDVWTFILEDGTIIMKEVPIK